MTQDTVSRYLRQSLRAELVGTTVLLAAVVLAVLCALDQKTSERLGDELWRGSPRGEGRATYPMLARYCPASPFPSLSKWAARVGDELLSSRLAEDWAEAPALPTGPSPAEPRPGELGVDRRRHWEFMRALASLIPDGRGPGDATGSARVTLATLAAVRQAVCSDVQALGGFRPSTQVLVSLADERFPLEPDILMTGSVPRWMLVQLIARATELDKLLPIWWQTPDAWPASAAGAMASREDQVDTRLLRRLLEAPKPPFPDLRRLSPGVHVDVGGQLLLDVLPCRFARARRIARELTESALRAFPYDAEQQLRLRTLALVAAAIMVRQDSGNWPTRWDELADLVPHRMRQDPFTRDDLRFRVVTSGLQVWSPTDCGGTTREAPVAHCLVLAGPVPEECDRP